MLKLIKWLAGLLLTVAILILLAVIIIPTVVDPNDYRDELSTLVKEQTGRDLKLEGDLKISVFPWIGIQTQGLMLSQPQGIEGQMVSVENAELRVKVMPLLSKQVEVDTVVLNQPMVSLVTLKNGLDSFAGLSDDSADTEQLEEDSAKTAVALAIQGVELTNGTVIIDDRQAGSRTELSELNVVTGNLIGDSLASIEITGQLKDSSSPDITLFDVDAKALIDTESFDVQAADVLAKITQGEQDISLNIDSLTFKQSSLVEITGLRVDVAGEFPAKAELPSFSANLDSQTASAASLVAEFYNAKAEIQNLKVTQFSDNPSATGRLNVAKFDAAKLLKTLEIDFEPADANALTSVAFKADFFGGLEQAGLKNLNLSLDNTTLSGSASVANFEKPSAKFNLVLDNIDLDKYLPETAEVEEEEVSGGEALLVPMAAFKEIDANGSFKASSFTSAGVTLTDIDVLVKSSPGQVTITPKAKLYDGKLDGAIAYKEQGEQTSLSVKNEIDFVQLGQLLNAADVTDQLNGLGSLLVDLTVTEANGVQSNEGTIKLLAKDGTIAGVDVPQMLGKANNVMQLLGNKNDSANEGDAAVEVQGEKNDVTEFAELLGTFYLKDFLVTNDDLSLTAPGFKVTGAGEIDLASETMNYLVNVAIAENIDGALGDQLGKLKGLTIPVRCKGSFEAPLCLPDAKKLYALYLNSKLNDKKAAFLQEKLGVENGDEISTKDALKQGLLNKLLKKDRQEQPADAQVERPISERDAPVEQAQDSEPEAEAKAEPREMTKKERRDARKKKLLESLLGN